LRVHINVAVWHLDVVLTHPRTVQDSKGLGVLQLKLLREMGLERCETVWSLSSVCYTNCKYYVVREETYYLAYSGYVTLKVLCLCKAKCHY